MAKRPARHSARWTAADLRALRKLAEKRLSARLAARELGRSVGAVKYKAMVEGIRFRAVEQPRGIQKRLARARRRAKAK